MFIYVCTAHRRCQAQIVAQDTEQKHGKHGSGAPLSSFPLLLVVVVACPLSIATLRFGESGTSAKLVDTSETRGW